MSQNDSVDDFEEVKDPENLTKKFDCRFHVSRLTQNKFLTPTPFNFCEQINRIGRI